MSESANWRQFKTAIENLGLDVRFPLVPEDDPRFRTVQAILAQFDGLPPSAPLPPGWEGNRPSCWDGTLHGLLEYLHWGLFAVNGDDGYPRAGPIYHYSRMLRNAYRMLHFLGIRDFASGVPNARDVCDGMAQIQKLRGVVQQRIAESPAKTPHTVAASCFATLSVPRWSDLGLGIRVNRHAIEVLAFVPCPTTGDRVLLKNAVPMQLTGNRWLKVLTLLADSSDGRTVSVGAQNGPGMGA